ncbi:MAG: hypothetical protein KJ653_06630 [Candidatus Thermoplasmatota archaeon]|nr:hypothetical protein [Candidatus Thermoplasmatota archaeon]MBU1913848.1 hypothetical protein [Candidatus Thermoplasmatota archaeon]
MNEKDIQLAHTVSSVIETDAGSLIYLVNTKHTNLVRVNLVLLKAFLDEKKQRGLLITIDRPHQYVSHLLQLHGVDQTNLTFLDVISSHAADTKAGAVAPEFQKGPFHIETLPDFFLKQCSDPLSLQIDMSKVDFVIIDNVATLLVYNTMESIKNFFQKYVEVLKSVHSAGIQTALLMDRDQHPDLFKFIAELSKKTIEIGPDMVIRRVSVLGEPVELPVETASRTSIEIDKVDKSIIKSKDVM